LTFKLMQRQKTIVCEEKMYWFGLLILQAWDKVLVHLTSMQIMKFLFCEPTLKDNLALSRWKQIFGIINWNLNDTMIKYIWRIHFLSIETKLGQKDIGNESGFVYFKIHIRRWKSYVLTIVWCDVNWKERLSKESHSLMLEKMYIYLILSCPK